ncbi:carotenoid oxygenase [Polychaeton citri CBS 116435]|uniref:Carotenoid oxygenase n=1 Tax=Polychaeton citri CBS 116435 TaxID=1314669 RepID=A0A9P4UTG3_9PEZI|nr:carotenoid oxygenase [Polychaeton citri CBS 116435]
MAVVGQKRKRAVSGNIQPTPQAKHPYLSGNFAPIHQTLPLTPCMYSGTIPEELADGEYVRNGSNPVSNEDLGRDAHWFDGDGMLAGVSFRKDKNGRIHPEFVNQFVLTDLYLNTISSPRLRVPILPSIATLVNPVASFFLVTLRILRTLILVLLSHLPGSKQSIKKISVANTNILFHDGRALATCESGPPIRVQLPSLETVGWYDGSCAEGEPERLSPEKEATFGQDGGLVSFMREWTTAHPKVDPETKEMLMFHSCFAPPYVQYSIVPQTSDGVSEQALTLRKEKVLNSPVPGITSAKMMHDFGASLTHTVIMDLPLSMDPINQFKGKAPVTYDSEKPSRFGVFPRRSPQDVKWFETDASCIFHTANTWNNTNMKGEVTAVNMLACRLTSATVVFAAGNIAPPVPPKKTIASAKKRMPFFSKYNVKEEPAIFDRAPLLESPSEEKEALIQLSDDHSPWAMDDLFDEEQCRLYFYQFDLRSGQIKHQWALSAVPFEFPSVRPNLEMQEARYIYGCSTTTTEFGSALGKATKIDALVKVDAASLIQSGQARPPKSVTGVLDSRSVLQILDHDDVNDPIRIFHMPEGWYAQEPRFVPSSTNKSEDDGYLLFYAFDECQLGDNGEVPLDSSPIRAKSELWIIDAMDMKTIVGRVHLPQRVPYGLHGIWFTSEQIAEQRPVDSIRSATEALSKKDEGAWMVVRDWVEKLLG